MEGQAADHSSSMLVVKCLLEPIRGSGRNVTMDRYYTSVDLAETLYVSHGLTMVGTMHSNRKHIPPELKNWENREEFSSVFAFTSRSPIYPPVALQSYLARSKPTRNLIFLSTQQQDDKVQERE